MEPKSIVCACGGTFTSSDVASHRRTCSALRRFSERTEAQRDVASELREALECHEKAQTGLREAEAAMLLARRLAAYAEADLATWRSKAAAVGLAGVDAATAESIRAWLFASPTVAGEGEATPRTSE